MWKTLREDFHAIAAENNDRLTKRDREFDETKEEDGLEAKDCEVGKGFRKLIRRII